MKKGGDLKKGEKVLEAENRRLRKLNEDYSRRIRKLEKLIECREKISIFSKVSSETLDY